MRPFIISKVRLGLLATLAPSLVAIGTVASIAVVSGGARGVAFAQARDGQAERSDAVINTDVTNALNSSAVLKSQEITSATIQGNVTLSGNVGDAASKELAGMLALRVAGVNAVSNNLTVNGQSGAGGQSDPGAQPYPNAQADPNAQSYPAAQPYPNAQPGPNNGQQMPPSQDPQYGAQNDPNAQNGPRPPYSSSGQYPQYSQNAAPEQVSGPVELPKGTLVKVRLSEFLDARKVQQGSMFEATAANDVYSGGVLAIPRGATLEGQVVDVKNPKGSLGGSEALTLKLNSLVLGGKTYTLDSDVWSSNGPGKAGYTAGNTITGAALGAIIGGIAGGGMGAGIGAAAGGATGAVGSAATSGPRLVLPPEAVLTFHLANPVTVQPVGQQEAQRLASAQRPSLQRRPGYAPYGYYPGYPPPSVAYGYPYGYYYRPYRYYYGR